MGGWFNGHCNTACDVCLFFKMFLKVSNWFDEPKVKSLEDKIPFHGQPQVVLIWRLEVRKEKGGQMIFTTYQVVTHSGKAISVGD